MLEREREGGVERTGEVALRRTARGAHGGVAGDPPDLDDEVAAAGELLEVVAGDVGVQLEPLGDLAGGDAGGRRRRGRRGRSRGGWGRRRRW